MSFPLDRPLYRYAIGKEPHPWRCYRRRDNPNAAIVKNLAKIEAKLRTEIALDESQTWLMQDGLMMRRLKAKKKLPPLLGGS